MSDSEASVTPQSILRRLSSVLLTDQGEGTNLLNITAILVLRNLLKNLEPCGSKVYHFLRIIVPYFVLLGGIYDMFLKAAPVQTAVETLVSYITAPLTARVVVSPKSPLK